MKWRYRLLPVLAVLLAGAVVWWVRPSSEPAYQGRGLSQWIAEIKAGDGSIPPSFTRSKAQREAIQAMGLEALPALLEAVQPLNAHESGWAATYRRWYVGSPPALRRHLPRPSWGVGQNIDFQNGVILDCQQLRPQSEPLLAQALRHPRPEVRATAAGALFGPTNTSPLVFAALTHCLRDPDEAVRLRVMHAISCFGPAASNAVPALVENLLPGGPPADFTHPDHYQATAALALGKIGSGAVAAVSVLQAGAVQRTNALLRVNSAIALWGIRHEAGEAFPVMLQEFGTADQITRWRILECFGEMRTDAAAAAPSLVAFLDSIPARAALHREMDQRLGLATLWKIAPEVAARQAVKAARHGP